MSIKRRNSMSNEKGAAWDNQGYEFDITEWRKSIVSGDFTVGIISSDNNRVVINESGQMHIVQL